MNLNVPLYRLSRTNVLLIEDVKIYNVRETLSNKKNTTTAVGVLNWGLIKCIQLKSSMTAKFDSIGHVL